MLRTFLALYQGFVSRTVKVYNAASPSQAVTCVIKGVVLNDTLPAIKYIALCALLARCCYVTVDTVGSTQAMSAAVNLLEAYCRIYFWLVF